MNVTPEVLGALLSFFFALGGAWFFVKQLRKDFNGFSHKTRLRFEQVEDKSLKQIEGRQKKIEMAILLIAKSDPEMRQIVGMLTDTEPHE